MTKTKIEPPGTWLFLTFTLFFSAVICKAQSQQAIDYNSGYSYFKNNPAEKLYLHTDRDIYAENDTIWFKAYLVNAHSLLPDNGPLRNVYVELINQNKEIVIRNMIAMKNGLSFGDFILPDYKITHGKYKLRAYTRYQTNFDNSFIFEKNILVTPVFSLKNVTAQKDSISNFERPQAIVKQEIDLQFLPEGGYLTSGLTNILAIKALDDLGNGIDISGSIYDTNDIELVKFATSHMGMGSLSFKPQSGKKYYAKLTTGEKRFPLPKASNLLLMAVNNSYANKMVSVKLRTNAMDAPPTNYYLGVTSAGLLQNFYKVYMNSAYKALKIPYSQFSMGINQIILLDSNQVPLRDRLIFIEKEEKNISLQINTDKQFYKEREPVKVTITALSAEGLAAANVSLSVSVTDEGLIKPITEYKENIVSYLLMSSELKGNIENPGYYFNPKNTEAKNHLDLLLLTQGWGKYIWNPIIDSLPLINYPKQYGIELSGSAKQIFLDKKLKETTLTISMKQGEDLFYDTITTDSEGNFVKKNLIIPDSVEVYFALPGKKNRKQQVSIQTFTPEYQVGYFNDFNIPSGNNLEAFTIQSIQHFIDDKTSHPEKYKVMMEEIVVEAKTAMINKNDGHFRNYSTADRVFEPNDTDEGYPNVLYYLSRAMPKVRYDGQTLNISGTLSNQNGQPMLLLDGIEVDLIDIENLPMNVVDKAEILYEPTSLALWPFDSPANRFGVISILTKQANAYEEYSQSDLVHVMRGYYPSRKFYSPKYNKISKTKNPDRRTTLLWAPIISTNDSGMATFSFYNNDNQGIMNIEVEGITTNGKPVTGYLKYEVK